MSNYISKAIKEYPDFPKKGIVFKDILPVLRNPEQFTDLINKMSSSDIFKNSDAVIAIDARGFIFGTVISMKLA